MAKVLISNIGTGDKDRGYKKAVYEFNGKREETPFIAKALSNFLDIDKIFLVGTKKSVWDNVYEEFGGDDEIALEIWDEIKNGEIKKDNLIKVEKQIDKYLHSTGSKCFIIDYGINDE